VSPGRKRRGPDLPYDLLAGVVPCRGGWLVAGGKLVGVGLHPDAPVVVKKLVDVVDAIPSYTVLTLAAPIGLPDKDRTHGRLCEREARKLLGWPRLGAILNAPSIHVVTRAKTYEDAERISGGQVSPISWALMRRIREVREVVQSHQQRGIYEVHPELSFYQLNDDRPMRCSKKTSLGQKERTELLIHRLPNAERHLDAQVRGASQAQVLDAYAALWTARRVAAHAVIRMPEQPVWNGDGLRMELVR
jgi:predicted RNase H-like nuclease